MTIVVRTRMLKLFIVLLFVSNSLLTVAATKKAKSFSWYVFYRQGESFEFEKKFTQALVSFNQASRTAKTLKLHWQHKTNIYLALCRVHRKLGNLEVADQYCTNALYKLNAASKNNSVFAAKVLMAYARLKQSKKLYQLTLKLALESYQIISRYSQYYPDLYLEVVAFLASYYKYISNYKMAEYYYQEMKQYLSVRYGKDHILTSRVLIDLAGTKILQRDEKEALKILIKLRDSAKRVEIERGRSHLISKLFGDLYFNKTQFSLAIKYYTKALDRLEVKSRSKTKYFIVKKIADAYKIMGQHDKSLMYYLMASRLANKQNYTSYTKIQANLGLLRIYVKLKNNSEINEVLKILAKLSLALKDKHISLYISCLKLYYAKQYKSVIRQCLPLKLYKIKDLSMPSRRYILDIIQINIAANHKLKNHHKLINNYQDIEDFFNTMHPIRTKISSVYTFRRAQIEFKLGQTKNALDSVRKAYQLFRDSVGSYDQIKKSLSKEIIFVSFDLEELKSLYLQLLLVHMNDARDEKLEKLNKEAFSVIEYFAVRGQLDFRTVNTIHPSSRTILLSRLNRLIYHLQNKRVSLSLNAARNRKIEIELSMHTRIDNMYSTLKKLRKDVQGLSMAKRNVGNANTISNFQSRLNKNQVYVTYILNQWIRAAYVITQNQAKLVSLVINEQEYRNWMRGKQLSDFSPERFLVPIKTLLIDKKTILVKNNNRLKQLLLKYKIANTTSNANNKPSVLWHHSIYTIKLMPK